MNATVKKAREIFVEAVGKVPPEQWDAYLADACAGDEPLRERVKHLLQAHLEAGSLLESPVAIAVATIDESIREAPGTVIGPYKLLQQIGEGGMGTVFMAEQTHPVQRKVALKVIKAGMDSRQVIARFEAERQALAMMDHVNIARVLDAGATESGRPYFVMELVHGVPITKYCDDNRLTPRERLELFVPVCQAIQHAHQKGIIHRDIKPSNVMITLYDGKPVPKVIDFGVAKATEQKLTERTLFTQYGTMVGTFEYMSPEQAEMSALGVDTRSDIFSLGVLLYELLTGSTPISRKRLREAAYDEILRMIKEEEPPKPSTRLSTEESLPEVAAKRDMEPAKLTRLVRGELDWIVMKSLEKDRNRRYETANGFAADVLHYLNDEPVQAGPPSAWYRFRKFSRRNRAGLAVAGLVLFFLVLLGSGAGWAVWDRAARAARTEDALRQILNDDVTSLIDQGKWREALEALKRADALVAGAEARLSPELLRQKETLARDRQLVDDLERIQLHKSEVDVQRSQFTTEKAIPKYRDVFARYGLRMRDQDVAEAAATVRQKRASIRTVVLAALDDWLNLESAKSHRDWLFRVVSAADSDDWRKRVRTAAAARDGPALERLAGQNESLAQSSATIVLLAKALEQRKAGGVAINLLRRAQARYPADFWISNDLAFALHYSRPPQLDEAVTYYRIALAIRPDNPGVHLNLSNALRKQGKLDAAADHLRQAIALEPTYAAAHFNLGIVLKDQGRLDEAMDHYRQAIELEPNDPAAWGNRGALYTDQLNQPDKGLRDFSKVIELRPNDAMSWFSRGNAYKALRQYDKALGDYSKAIELKPDYAEAWNNRGILYTDYLNQPAKGVVDFSKAVELNPAFVEAWCSRGVAHMKSGLYDKALADYSKAIELKPNYAEAWGGRGDLHRTLGRHDKALADFNKAIELKPDDVAALGNRGILYTDRLNQPAKGVADFSKVIELKPHEVNAWGNRGVAYSKLGLYDKAVADFSKAIELNSKLTWIWWKRAMAHTSLKQWDKAMADFSKALELAPEDPWANNAVAWLLVTCPGAKLRNPTRAVDLAKKAVAKEPKNSEFWNTLGVAHYRAGSWKDSIAALGKSMELGKGGDSSDWFFVAMAHWQLGDKNKAHNYYDKAADWMDKNQPKDEELMGFRDEAAALLGIKDKPKAKVVDR